MPRLTALRRPPARISAGLTRWSALTGRRALLLVLSLLPALPILAADPVPLFEATDSRARVVHSAFAYYPGKMELRVRLTLENRQVKSGLFRNPEVVRHLLTLLTATGLDLYCTFDGNEILAVISQQQR